MTRHVPDDMRIDATPYYASLYQEAMDEAAKQPEKCARCGGLGYFETPDERDAVDCQSCGGSGRDLDDMNQVRV